MGKNDEDAATDHESVSAVADRLGLTGEDRTRYIHKHMTGFGYRMQPSYVPRDDDDNSDDDDDYFPRRRRRASGSRDDQPRQSGGRQRRSSGGDEWYS